MFNMTILIFFFWKNIYFFYLNKLYFINKQLIKNKLFSFIFLSIGVKNWAWLISIINKKKLKVQNIIMLNKLILYTQLSLNPKNIPFYS